MLGPLLFLIYINVDLFNSSKLLHFILFADDTNIFFNHKDITTLTNTDNNELKHVSSVFSANKLTLHPDKTKYIIFHPSRKKMDLTNCKIKINTTTISRVQSAKFLGVIIHQNLSWKPHIEMICSKTSKVIGLICKARQYLHSNTLKTLYNSLFLPYVNYCNLIWASTYNSHINPLLLLQKKAIRIITFSPPRTHTKPIFQKLNILPIFSLYKFQVSAFVFFHINKLLPSALSSLFQFNFECHSHQTRSRFNLHKQFLKCNFSLRSQAPAVWNSLPLPLRESLYVSNFKLKLKLLTFSLSNITVYQEDTLLLL